MKTIIGAVVFFIVTVVVFSDEPTTIVRIRGKAGIAERVESRGKAVNETIVHVRLSKTIDDVVVQERTVVKGADAFDANPVKERKDVKKERPLPASVEKKVQVGK